MVAMTNAPTHVTFTGQGQGADRRQAATDAQPVPHTDTKVYRMKSLGMGKPKILDAATKSGAC